MGTQLVHSVMKPVKALASCLAAQSSRKGIIARGIVPEWP